METQYIFVLRAILYDSSQYYYFFQPKYLKLIFNINFNKRSRTVLKTVRLRTLSQLLKIGTTYTVYLGYFQPNDSG